MYSRHGYGSHPGSYRGKHKEDRVKRITKNQISKKEKYRSGKKVLNDSDSDEKEDKPKDIDKVETKEVEEVKIDEGVNVVGEVKDVEKNDDVVSIVD